MKIQADLGGKLFESDLSKPLSISIPIGKTVNPNCYGTNPVLIEPVRSGEFIGSIEQGAAVNHKQITIAPHGNGTHTECSGHVFDNGLTIDKAVQTYNCPAQVISIAPIISGDNRFISEEQIDFTMINPHVRALAIRTMPNTDDKLTRSYSGTNPPFIAESAMKKIVDNEIDHLIVDLPSVDPEIDNGRLKAHRIYWEGNRREKECTITELAYIPNDIKDGLYLLNLQVLRIQLDASPSNPILYPLSTS